MSSEVGNIVRLGKTVKRKAKVRFHISSRHQTFGFSQIYIYSLWEMPLKTIYRAELNLLFGAQFTLNRPRLTVTVRKTHHSRDLSFFLSCLNNAFVTCVCQPAEANNEKVKLWNFCIFHENSREECFASISLQLNYRNSRMCTNHPPQPQNLMYFDSEEQKLISFNPIWNQTKTSEGAKSLRCFVLPQNKLNIRHLSLIFETKQLFYNYF